MGGDQGAVEELVAAVRGRLREAVGWGVVSVVVGREGEEKQWVAEGMADDEEVTR
ncbi:hypothetical protein [Kolteria novifilia]|uniref:hypothetical protein n=1 Tax=Kolteria novifilia TaxID=2527975 RepID=UPI003AF3D762